MYCEEEVPTVLRNLDLTTDDIDYQSMFNEFTDAELAYDDEIDHLTFTGVQSLDSSILEEVDLNSLTTDLSDKVDIEYEFEYYANENLYVLNVIANNVEEGVIFESLIGNFYTNEKKLMLCSM